MLGKDRFMVACPLDGWAKKGIYFRKRRWLAVAAVRADSTPTPTRSTDPSSDLNLIRPR